MTDFSAVIRYGVLLTLALLCSCTPEPGPPSSPLPDNPTGKIVFINYWAEWCKPCREEIPELNRFYQDHRQRVDLYGVNFDGLQGEALAGQEQALGIAFPTLAVDPAPYLQLPPPAGLPHTLVLDGNNQLVLQLQGQQTRESLVAALLQVEQGQGRGLQTDKVAP